MVCAGRSRTATKSDGVDLNRDFAAAIGWKKIHKEYLKSYMAVFNYLQNNQSYRVLCPKKTLFLGIFLYILVCNALLSLHLLFRMLEITKQCLLWNK